MVQLSAAGAHRAVGSKGAPKGGAGYSAGGACEDVEDTVFARVTSSASWYCNDPTARSRLPMQALELLASSPGLTLSVCEALVLMLSRGTKEVPLLQMTVGGVEFKSRQDLKSACSRLLSESPCGERLSVSDSAFLKSLLELHPHGREKAQDVRHFTTGTDGEQLGKYFVAIRRDGQQDGFSYLRCIDNVRTGEIVVQEEICDLLIKILQLHPSACDEVARMFAEKFPFMRGAGVELEKHRNWVRALLYLADRLAVLTEFLLLALLRRMLDLDADIARLEDQDIREETDGQLDVLAQVLDVMMMRVFEFLQRRLDGQARLQAAREVDVTSSEGSLVHTMWGIFERYVLATHKVRHVPFLYFYVASLRPAWTEVFLILLLRGAHGANVPLHRRLISTAYVASFIARARFLTPKYTFKTTMYMVQLARETFQAAEARIAAGETAHPQVLVFLGAVQAVCYILCWHAEAFSAERTETGVSALGVLLPPPGGPGSAEALSPILESPCQPICLILRGIAERFVRVLRTHNPALAEALRAQLRHAGQQRFPRRGAKAPFGVADEEMEEEQITGLDGFFPFDPYRLRHSQHFVRPHYRSVEEIALPDGEDSDGCEEAEASDNAGGFQVGMEATMSRARCGSQVSMDESSDGDFADAAPAEERGFVPSVGPSPAFRPLGGDMVDVSPLILPMEGADDEDSFQLPMPSIPAHGNSLLSQFMQGSAYQAGARST